METIETIKKLNHVEGEVVFYVEQKHKIPAHVFVGIPEQLCKVEFLKQNVRFRVSDCELVIN